MQINFGFAWVVLFLLIVLFVGEDRDLHDILIDKISVMDFQQGGQSCKE